MDDETKPTSDAGDDLAASPAKAKTVEDDLSPPAPTKKKKKAAPIAENPYSADDDDDAPAPPPKRKKKPVSTTPKRPVRKVIRYAASHWVPHAIVGMLFLAGHVKWDLPYDPMLVIGICIITYAYMRIGETNEILTE